eukprot:2048182-Pleurochrysis_carterae.AAC.2
MSRAPSITSQAQISKKGPNGGSGSAALSLVHADDRDDLDVGDGLVALIDLYLLNALDHVGAPNHAAEDRVLVVEPCRRRGRDEELARGEKERGSEREEGGGKDVGGGGRKEGIKRRRDADHATKRRKSKAAAERSFLVAVRCGGLDIALP